MGVGLQPCCCGDETAGNSYNLGYSLWVHSRPSFDFNPDAWEPDWDLYIRVRDTGRTIGFINESQFQRAVAIDDGIVVVPYDLALRQLPIADLTRGFMEGYVQSAIYWRCSDGFVFTPAVDIQDQPVRANAVEGYTITTGFPHRYNFWTHQPLPPGSSGPPYANVFAIYEQMRVTNRVQFDQAITPETQAAFTLRVQAKSAFSGLSGTFDLAPAAPNVVDTNTLAWEFPGDEANPLFEEVGLGVGAHSHTDETSRIYCWYPFFQTLPDPNNTFPADIDEKCGWP